MQQSQSSAIRGVDWSRWLTRNVEFKNDSSSSSSSSSSDDKDTDTPMTDATTGLGSTWHASMKPEMLASVWNWESAPDKQPVAAAAAATAAATPKPPRALFSPADPVRRKWQHCKRMLRWCQVCITRALVELNARTRTGGRVPRTVVTDTTDARQTMSWAQVERLALDWLEAHQMEYFSVLSYKGYELLRPVPAVVFYTACQAHLAQRAVPTAVQSLVAPTSHSSAAHDAHMSRSGSTNWNDDDDEDAAASADGKSGAQRTPDEVLLRRRWNHTLDDILMQSMGIIGAFMLHRRRQHTTTQRVASSTSSSSSSSADKEQSSSTTTTGDGGDRFPHPPAPVTWQHQTVERHASIVSHAIKQWQQRLVLCIDILADCIVNAQHTRSTFFAQLGDKERQAIVKAGQRQQQQQQQQQQQPPDGKAEKTGHVEMRTTEVLLLSERLAEQTSRLQDATEDINDMSETGSRVYASIRTQLAVLERFRMHAARNAPAMQMYAQAVQSMYAEIGTFADSYLNRILVYEPTSEDRAAFQDLVCAHALSAGTYMNAMRARRERPPIAPDFPRLRLNGSTRSQFDMESLLSLLEEGDTRVVSKDPQHPLLPFAKAYYLSTVLNNTSGCKVVKDWVICQDFFHRHHTRIFRHDSADSDVRQLCRPVMVALLGQWYVADVLHNPECRKRNGLRADAKQDAKCNECVPQLFPCADLYDAFLLWVAIVLVHYNGTLEGGQRLHDWHAKMRTEERRSANRKQVSGRAGQHNIDSGGMRVNKKKAGGK
jgi:hypothetical protein